MIRGLMLALSFAALALPAAAAERGELKKRAKAGDAVAMRELARDYHLGLDGWKSKRSAERWARNAIYAGDVEAQLELAQQLSRGDRGELGDAACFWALSAARQGVPAAALQAGDCLAEANIKAAADEAHQWYLRALAAGVPGVERRLFTLHDRRVYGETDADAALRRAEADRWRILAAQHGDLDSLLELARGYRYGDKVPDERATLVVLDRFRPPASDPTRFKADLPESARWYALAQSTGDLRAQAEYGDLLFREQPVRDLERAMPLLQAAAARGSSLALRDLGEANRLGIGAPMDKAAAQQWYLLAGRRDDAEAAWQRARWHLEPHGGAYSLRRARYWLTRAAPHHPRAASRLSLMYLRGEGVEPNRRKAEALMESAASDGDADAKLLLARLKMEGKVFDRDVPGAERYAEQVHERTDGALRLALARACAQGDGLDEPDLESAAKWYTRAAEAGEVAGMVAIAGLLEDGLSGPPDAQAAAQWFHRAADAGDASAQLRFAAMLDDGRGVARDPAAAAEWRARAAATAAMAAQPTQPQRPSSADRALAAQGKASIASLSWGADAYTSELALEVLDAPPAGALRSRFTMNDAAEGLTTPSAVGIEVEGTVFERVRVLIEAEPVPDHYSGVRHYALVVEHVVGDAVRRRVVLGPDRRRYGGDRHWAEIGWDAAGKVRVRVDGYAQLEFTLETPRVLSAAARIDGADGKFDYLTVD